MDLDRIIAEIKSGNLQRQKRALDESSGFLKLVLAHGVEALKDSSDPYLLAESLYPFCSTWIQILEETYLQTNSGQVKTALANLLVQSGSKFGVDELIGLLDQHLNGAAVFATNSLAKAGINGARPIILQQLERMQTSFYMKRENAPIVVTFIL